MFTILILTYSNVRGVNIGDGALDLSFLVTLKITILMNITATMTTTDKDDEEDDSKSNDNTKNN